MVEFACTRRPVLGTPALAGETPWQKTQQARSVSRSCARVRRVAFYVDYYDILTEADVCTRLSALAGSNTGWRPAMCFEWRNWLQAPTARWSSLRYWPC